MKPNARKAMWTVDRPHPSFKSDAWVECACGCGQKIHPVDPYGMVRKWVKGHHARKPQEAHRSILISFMVTKEEKANLEELAERLTVTLKRKMGLSKVLHLAVAALKDDMEMI